MCAAGNHRDPIAVAIDDNAAAGIDASASLIKNLVVANHILFDQNVVDAFGHVSVRHDKRPDRFLLARNVAPGRVAADDIVEFTLDGEAVNANGRNVYLERFIHGEIYRRREDVQSVVHSHSHAIVPLSIVKGMRMRPVFHMAGFIGQGAPVFEIREAGGESTDLLISSSQLGRALAEKFDSSDIVLMRGHGSTVVGQSIQQAVYRAVYAELNARYQLEAMQLGEVVHLTEGESRAAVRNVEAQMHRPWDLWVEQARARRAAG
ncbi:class II aldolase/adducin family protein [Phyllobacterium sophorae]|uniref:Aldolase n=1 Tax=Phyllobacterium sophorae TaxID=1520277 RepID=A0A2P7BFG3_9HYPH|nr:class II aldolase/adducin family protein [Phyllobacterium sophorae]PSH65236.1 aldolase [Phyllobacterium sophorae]